MAWIESPYRKKRTRYYNNKKAELERLNAKWTNEFRKLGVGNALDRDSTAYQGERTNGMLLSYYKIHNPAWNYATNKAQSSLTWYQSLVSGNGGVAILSFVIAVVTAVVSFVCPPFAPFGFTLFGGLSGVGFLARCEQKTDNACLACHCEPFKKRRGKSKNAKIQSLCNKIYKFFKNFSQNLVKIQYKRL